jgi:hypothetical protein
VINLKDNIWIEGYDNHKSCNYATLQYEVKNILYFGLTRNVIATGINGLVERKIVNIDSIPTETYKNYKIGSLAFGRMATWGSIFNAQQSILSACNGKYCIIFKK